jgi:glycosyltransferase involved in cell wall biosynthesis
VPDVLHVIPRLAYGGLARQLCLLVVNLPRDRFGIRVCALGTPAPWDEPLRAAGVPVDDLGWKRPFDVRPLFALRRLLREGRPEVVHVWGPLALAAVALAGGTRGGRLVVSGMFPPDRAPGWVERRLVPRAAVVAFGAADAGRYREMGLRTDQVYQVAPAVDLAWPPAPAATDAGGTSPPAEGRMILGVGPLEPHKGFRDAVWAFDILRYLFDDLRLTLAGDGSDRPRVEAFVRVTRTAGRVRCPGAVPDLAPLRRRAALAWVPSRTGGGVNAALEAMAAGLPVVATRVPVLAEVVADGETGLLVPPGDKAALARQTRVLVDDPALARRLGESGRRVTAERHTPAQLAEGCARAYAGGPAG